MHKEWGSFYFSVNESSNKEKDEFILEEIVS